MRASARQGSWLHMLSQTRWHWIRLVALSARLRLAVGRKRSLTLAHLHRSESRLSNGVDPSTSVNFSRRVASTSAGVHASGGLPRGARRSCTAANSHSMRWTSTSTHTVRMYRSSMRSRLVSTASMPTSISGASSRHRMKFFSSSISAAWSVWLGSSVSRLTTGITATGLKPMLCRTSLKRPSAAVALPGRRSTLVITTIVRSGSAAHSRMAAELCAAESLEPSTTQTTSVCGLS
mmetsp:Transcript_45002/g.105139  ORF Transcript_45002/g.105139 Transcript_45002/m.105139 type:complete len:235 (-) Transcript_45002:416-1120(-)